GADEALAVHVGHVAADAGDGAVAHADLEPAPGLAQRAGAVVVANLAHGVPIRVAPNPRRACSVSASAAKNISIANSDIVTSSGAANTLNVVKKASSWPPIVTCQVSTGLVPFSNRGRAHSSRGGMPA